MNNTFYIDSPYLQHYGVLGMKWGIRRYQNPDGTLTRLGRKRVRKAMQQHDIAMSKRDPQEKEREYKKFRDIVTNMYPAETADLIPKIEQAERLRKLSEVKEEDKVMRGLQYAEKTAKILETSMSALKNTAEAVDKFGSAKKNFEQARQWTTKADEAEYDLQQKKKTDAEKAAGLLDTVKDLADGAKATKEAVKAVADTAKGIEEFTKTVSNNKESKAQKAERERRMKSVPKSARKDYQAEDNAIFRQLSQDSRNEQKVFKTYTNNYNTSSLNNQQSQKLESLIKDYERYNYNPKKLKPIRYSSDFKINEVFYVIPKNSDMVHHGVLGMKWGVRRYQNKDGSLTKAGRRRYGIDSYRSTKQYQNRLNDLDTARGLIDRKIETRQQIKDKLISTKAQADAYIDFDGGTIGEKVKSKLAGKAIEQLDKSISEKQVVKEKGAQEMVEIIEKLQQSGFKITTKPTIRNVNSGADYVANLLAGPGAAAGLGYLTLASIPIAGPVAAPLAAGIVGASVLSASVYSLGKNIQKGTKFKVEGG